MFVDASAIVAILTRETAAAYLSALLIRAKDPMTSAVAILEAAIGIARKRTVSVELVQNDLEKFLAAAKIRIVEISGPEALEAFSAFLRYGKGHGHWAQLNLGDCFAYAVAKTHGVPLLFKGEDFSKTDIAIA
jgi:ribonuclease VapC